MTVCIAAFSHPDRMILAVSDRMVTVGDRTADNAALKQFHIHRDWFALVSGDVALAMPILQDATTRLAPERQHSALEVGEAVRQAWVLGRARLAESQVLSAYGLSMERFIGLGAKPSEFSVDEHRRLSEAIEQVALECDFLLCGFDLEKYPHVLSLENGVVSDFDTLGYWAIGSGAALALDALAAREQSMRCDAPSTAYHLLEARFTAESDSGVGKGETMLVKWRWGYFPDLMLGPVVAALRQSWKAYRQGYPPGALDIVREGGGFETPE